MWLDNASEIDMLFYEPYAKLITNICKNKEYNPITIGIFGLWGAGKSTLLRLIEKEFSDDHEKIVCISINAWMFEGYEDAKTALMESLLNEIDSEKHKGIFNKATEEIKGLLKRIDYFKLGTDLMKKGIPIAVSIATGNPMPLLLSLPADKEGVQNAVISAVDGIKSAKENYIKEKSDSTVENIRQFRNEFEIMLEKAEVNNVVVLVDDLDRCTPERIIETLEAIKLFLSVKRTTFVIAADETVIEYAIKKKYPRLEGSEVILSDEYIEKIIQLPINIPDLSSKDIENYLLLLVAQMYMNQEKFSELLQMIQEKHLAIREEGIKLKELNEMIESIDNPFEKSTEEYLKDVEIINEIKDIVSANLKGNPRQTKRFLNTFVTKKELAQMYYGENINIRILAKILVLQKISPDLFSQLNEWNKEFTIYNEKFKTMYNAVLIDKTNIEDYIQWRTPSLMKWLKCDPQELDKIRLDKYFYLTREKLRTSILNVNNLSYEAKEILEEMGNSSEATIEGIVDKLNTIQPESVDNVIEMILSQTEDGKISMYVIKTIYIKCKSYRRKILMTLEKSSKKFELDDVPYFKTMLNEDEANVKELLNKIKGNTLTVSLYNKIFNIKAKRG